MPESNSFVQNIFAGEAKAENFFPYPKVLNSEELSLIEMVTEPINKIWNEQSFDPLKLEDSEQLDESIFTLLKEMGSFGIQVPAEYGGMGCNNTQYARLAEITGQYDLAIGIILGAHQSIGYKGLLLFGNQKQKDTYLPLLASGEKLAAFALTEPGAGKRGNLFRTQTIFFIQAPMPVELNPGPFCQKTKATGF